MFKNWEVTKKYSRNDLFKGESMCGFDLWIFHGLYTNSKSRSSFVVPTWLVSAFFPSQKLEDLEKEEELKERAGEYDSDDESEDEDMQEIRSLAKQIREKKQLMVMESREKDVHGPRMPRTATKVRRDDMTSYNIWKPTVNLNVSKIKYMF